jgi:hypothetical protein
LPRLLLPFVDDLTAEEIADARAIAAAFGDIEASGAFCEVTAAIARAFILNVTEASEPGGEDAERYVMTRIAQGSSGAAAMIRAARTGELAWRYQQTLMRLLSRLNYTQFGEPLTIEAAERMVAHARAELKCPKTMRRGPRRDTALTKFFMTYALYARVLHVRPFPPALLVAGISKALERAVLRARKEPSCAGAIKQLNRYRYLSKGAIRNRVHDYWFSFRFHVFPKALGGRIVYPACADVRYFQRHLAETNVNSCTRDVIMKTLALFTNFPNMPSGGRQTTWSSTGANNIASTTI